MCVLSIKVLIRKNPGNLFNDPRIYIYIYIYIYIFIYIWVYGEREVEEKEQVHNYCKYLTPVSKYFVKLKRESLEYTN